ncbi:uncharacterized protein EKO05_0004394 [Ascochyta rabiei]|uniref:uncharacterized protein n=1 Tax=Didymella rabiei TaxID=5454 RepID=UPI00220890C1|nr:uncharacterized protein EKO05_0004394 [Ascochyta rabiei]UPX13898.1 hypothetical protein EKO05_0004394 [Ascochyta rabiei]
MAPVQEYWDPSALYPSPPQPRARFAYSSSTSAPLCNYKNLTQEAPMAQPLLVSSEAQSNSRALTVEQQRSFRPEEQIQPAQWSMSQECIPLSMSGNSMRAQHQLWGQLPAFSNSMMWSELHTDPLIMSQTDHPMFANGDLSYSQIARQNALGRTGVDLDSSLYWPSSGMNNLHRTNTAPSSNEDLLLSPVSPFSDAKHTYSPGPESDQITSVRGSVSYPTGMKVSSSPDFVPATPQLGSMLPYQPGSAAIQNDLGFAMAPAGAFQLGSAAKPAHSATPCGSDCSCEHLQSTSPNKTPWHPPGYGVETSAMIQDIPSQVLPTPWNDLGPKSSMTFIDRSMRQRQPQWSNKSSGVPAQGHFETRFMAPSTAGEKARRASDDEVLLQMKQDGYTYRDIRRALHRKVAESTLRGRYRSLTKPRKMRVRAPKWTEVDITLLKRYVQEEFDKLDVTHPSLETKQKPDKIPWMKIVETIATTGGTYKFGAATAKKKWVELARFAPVRSSRGRGEA